MNGVSDNTRGAALMICSMAAFSFGDACVKAMAGLAPLSQILVLRGIMATAFILGLAWRMGALRWDFPKRDWGLVALRSVAEVGAAWFFLTALFHMPIANLTALLQMLPLTVTLGSALVFREAVGWRRWVAIAIGFSGMLFIVKPGAEGFNHYALYGLMAVLCVTVRDLSTRRMSAQVPSLMVTLCASGSVLVFAALLSFGEQWQPVDGTVAALVVGSALFIIGGYLFSVMVMRVGEISFVAPFRYTGLLWALLLGLVFFDEWPGALTLMGGAIVMATGIYTLLRERALSRAKRARI